MALRRDGGRMAVGIAVGALLFLLGLFLVFETYYLLAYVRITAPASWAYLLVGIMLFALGYWSVRWGIARK